MANGITPFIQLSSSCKLYLFTPPKHTDEQIKEALRKSEGNVTKAAKLLKCAKVTIIRRQNMWSEGRKLKLPVGRKRKARRAA